MVLAFFVFLFVQPRRSRWLRWIGIVASLVLLFLSGSATGIVVCIAMLATLPLYKLAKARFTLVIPVSLGLGLLLAGSLLILKTSTGEVFQLVHRSPDMTGRTELWNAVLVSISKRPWLGYGFSAFWESMRGESESVRDAVGWAPGYSHDGYLDVMLQLGVAGLVTFVPAISSSGAEHLHFYRERRDPLLSGCAHIWSSCCSTTSQRGTSWCRIASTGSYTFLPLSASIVIFPPNLRRRKSEKSMNSSRTVIVYRDTMLPPTETFVRGQAESLNCFNPIYVCLRRTSGLSLPESRVHSLCPTGIAGKAQRARFKLLGPSLGQQRAMAKQNPILFHAHFAPDACDALSLVRALNIPLVVSLHGYDVNSSDDRLPRLYLQRRELLKSDAVRFICISKFIRQQALAKGFPAEKMRFALHRN